MVFEGDAAAVAVVVEQFVAGRDVDAGHEQQVRPVLDFDHLRNQVTLRPAVVHQPAQSPRLARRVHTASIKSTTPINISWKLHLLQTLHPFLRLRSPVKTWTGQGPKRENAFGAVQ